jgi:predicted permease
MDVLRQDLRYALRRLGRAPGFTLIALLTLSLGIGANTAIFSLINAALFRPVPLAPRPDRLVAIFTSDFSSSQYSASSWPDYEDFRRETGIFSNVAALTTTPFNLARGNQLERVQAELVSADYFPMLGLTPARGRLLGPADDVKAGAAPVIVLSEAFWQSRLAADPAVVGTTMTVNGQPHTVVGIAPEGFHGISTGQRIDAWAPVQQMQQFAPGNLFTQRGDRAFLVFARLRDGITIEAAQARMRVLQNQLFRAYPEPWTRLNGQSRLISVLSERAARVPPDQRGSVFTLGGLVLGAVALVLLICCANVANLLLARAEVRAREIAIRYSLGARRTQVVRQLMLESLLLAMIGGAGGMLFSSWASDLLLSFQPSSGAPVYVDVSPDVRVLIFTLAATLITGLLFGVAPALQSTRADLADTLRRERSVAGGGRFALRDLLVAGQIALALTLSIAAGLFARTLSKASQVDVGLDPRNMVVARLDLGTQGYDAARTATFYRELRSRLEAHPDVQATTLASRIELANPGGRRGVRVPGYELQPGEEREFPFNVVAANYFAALRVRIMQGRTFTDQDRADSRPVIIVNESFARRFWPGENPIGKQVNAGGDVTREVVGVARDGKYWALNEAPRPFFYLPYEQQPTGAALFVRARSNDDRAIREAIRNEVRALDPLLPILVLDSMEGQMSRAVLAQRVAGTLVGLFALLALLLAAVGVYGVTSVLVAQRIPEIGLRIALGASTGNVLRMIVQRAMLVAGAGLVVGLLFALVATRGLESLLFGVSRFDPITLGVATAVLGSAALLAGFLPARRATRVDPLVALKS